LKVKAAGIQAAVAKYLNTENRVLLEIVPAPQEAAPATSHVPGEPKQPTAPLPQVPAPPEETPPPAPIPGGPQQAIESEQ